MGTFFQLLYPILEIKAIALKDHQSVTILNALKRYLGKTIDRSISSETTSSIQQPPRVVKLMAELSTNHEL
jgi:hypothetical protein